MVALGRPGAGEELLADAGFVDVERVEIPFAWEFADPESYARALASTGPAYEAIQAVGEEAFLRAAIDVAAERVRDGLPLRAPIAVVGYVGPQAAGGGDSVRAARRRPAPGSSPPRRRPTPSRRCTTRTSSELGYVMNASRLWAHLPGAQDGLFDLLGDAVRRRLADVPPARHPRHRLRVDARRLVLLAGVGRQAGRRGRRRRSPAGCCAATTTRSTPRSGRWPVGPAGHPRPQRDVAADVEALRDAGFDDAQIFAITFFVALRMAFSTVNDALGARPDRELLDDGARRGPRRRDVRATARLKISSNTCCMSVDELVYDRGMNGDGVDSGEVTLRPARSRIGCGRCADSSTPCTPNWSSWPPRRTPPGRGTAPASSRWPTG